MEPLGVGTVSEQAKKMTISQCEAALKTFHDLAGKIHILQFCSEEISERVKSKDCQIYLEKLNHAGDDLVAIISLARQVFKTATQFESKELSFFCREVTDLSRVYYWKETESVAFRLDPQLSEVIVDTFLGSKIREFLFSIYCHLCELAAGGAENVYIDLILENLDSDWMELKLVTNPILPSMSEVIALVGIGDIKQKTYRRLEGFNIEVPGIISMVWDESILIKCRWKR